MDYKGHKKDFSKTTSIAIGQSDDFVLSQQAFTSIFTKDIQKVFMYKKAERLAKAVQLITPAFGSAPVLRRRAEVVALHILDAAAPEAAQSGALARALLSLSGLLALARAGGLLSAMNADILAREAELLLSESNGYAEPRIAFDEVPSLSQVARAAAVRPAPPRAPKGHLKDIQKDTPRKDTILSIIKDKGTAGIKDITMRIRGVSEKTIQRELQTLVSDGVLTKKGQRRWSTYALAG